MPKYLSDHQVYDPLTKTERHIQLLIDCPHNVLEHLPEEILANIAAGLPERGFTLTVKVLEPGESPTGKKQKR